MSPDTVADGAASAGNIRPGVSALAPRADTATRA
jgi:hypothetical protein